MKVLESLSTLKNGKLCSANFAMNRLSAAILHVSLCTFFLDPRGFMWTIVFILSGLDSISFTKTKQPKTLPFAH
jgi:hypothetical protein